jgi:hypothetical protein
MFGSSSRHFLKYMLVTDFPNMESC